MKKLNILGVAAGQGVCLYPFHKSKYFRVLGNIEPRGVFYAKGNPQWEANFPGIPMDKQLKIKRRVDVIIGHPDCGDSSILRMSRAKVTGKPSENHSIQTYLKAVIRWEPKVFVMENLPGLLKGLPLEKWPQEILQKYQIKTQVASVAVYGNSQVSRVRLVIVGTRNDVASGILLPFPQDILQPKPSEAFEMGSKEIEKLAHVREPLSKLTNLYLGERRQITYQEAQERWNGELSGSSRWSVGGKMKNQPGVSKNLKGIAPLTVRKQNRQFGTEGLVLSPREMSNIQGVPLEFKLHYSNSNSIYWINKCRLAVTKSACYEMGLYFMRELRKQHRKTQDIKKNHGKTRRTSKRA